MSVNKADTIKLDQVSINNPLEVNQSPPEKCVGNTKMGLSPRLINQVVVLINHKSRFFLQGLINSGDSSLRVAKLAEIAASHGCW